MKISKKHDEIIQKEHQKSNSWIDSVVKLGNRGLIEASFGDYINEGVLLHDTQSDRKMYIMPSELKHLKKILEKMD